MSKSVVENYWDTIGDFPLINRKDEKAHFRKVVAGDEEAREVAITSNLRLVIKIAYGFKSWKNGLDFEDLIQEGNIGLVKAVDKYNPELNVPFSSYAANWIKAYMTNSIYQKGRTIRTPVVKARNISKAHKAKAQLETELKREPTTEELADLTGFTEKKLKKLMRSKVETVSMQTGVQRGGNGGTKTKYVEDFVPEDRDAVEDLSRKEEYLAIDDAIDSLSEIEQYIVRSYCQLNGAPKKTFQALGEELGKSKQAVRAILVRSQRKMKKYLQDVKGISR